MATTDARRFRDNWRAEADAIFLYEGLAQAEANPELKTVYQKLADTERRHAAVWAEKLAALGLPLPRLHPAWRTRAFRWLAKRFGTGLVLPSLAAIERQASTGYDQQSDAAAAGMPQDERSHARIFSVLGGAQPQGMSGSEVAKLEGRHRTGGNALRAGVLGANDGLVSNFSLVMGVAGAAAHGSWILLTGLTGMLAGAISMALGEWLSVQSSRELYGHQISLEKQELESAPEEEKEELALIYQAKGLPADEAQRLAARLLSDPASALETLTREELGIDPDELGGSAWVAAGTSFLLFALGAVIPVLPFLWLHGTPGAAWSAGVSALGLFVIGAAITLVTGRPWLWAGVRQVLIGLAAAAVTYGLGRLIGANL